ncbi:helix-turn-helix domain-containing protein [Fredinandcohnia humi]
MKESKANLILHPVRMRIAQTLLNGRRLTVQQIGEKLGDIPQATLYRHLKKLVDGKVLVIVDKNQVRGTIEKVYALPENAGVISKEDMEKWDKDDHMESFMKFITTVLGDFERYLSQGDFDVVKDQVSYRQMSVYATDEEFLEFADTYRKAIFKLAENEQSENRRKRIITTIVTPDK